MKKSEKRAPSVQKKLPVLIPLMPTLNKSENR